MELKLKKSLGQNFLNDNHILEEMVEIANISDTDTVLEIGPGLGSLTHYIAKKAKKVIAIEIDKRLEEPLKEKFGDAQNIDVIFGDILEIDLKKLFNQGDKVKVIANIPYYITTPIIEKLLNEKELITDIYMTIQKEVAERVVAKPGNKSYGILTLFVKYFAESSLIFVIDRRYFRPIPKVDSAFINIKPMHLERAASFEDFIAIVKLSFSGRRKTLLNNLVKLGREKNVLSELLTNNGMDPNKRAEQFSIDEFIKLNEILKI